MEDQGTEKRSLRLRNTERVNYKKLSNLTLPRAKKVKCDDRLYPVEVVDKEDHRVKIHYLGYDSSYDEWREYGDVVPLTSPDIAEGSQPLLQPFSLYAELGIKIKQALTCGRKESPSIRIDMPFDVLLFNGGLKIAGVPSQKIRGTQRYKINHFRDLNPFFGQHWHFRGLNTNGDYSYVVLETVEFHLHSRRQLVEYCPPMSASGSISENRTDIGYALTFCFVRGCGTKSTFGKDNIVFYEYT